MTMEKLLQFAPGTGPKKVKHHRHHHKLKYRFQFEKTLGKGTYGKVKLATEIDTGKKVAIKTIPKSKIEDPEDLRRIRQEIELMSSLVHPHIIAIHEVFESKDKIVLVMEYACGGELYDYVDRQDISEAEARRIFRQIVSAVAFCHMNNIVHRDLKLENILLDEHNNVKIGDFGLSSRYDDNRLLSTFCGSPLYASPEIVSGKPYHGPEIDCWCLGVLLYALVYRNMPFKEDVFAKLKQHIIEGDYQEVPFRSDAESLIQQLLRVNPKHRATIDDVMAHNWLCQEYSPRTAFPSLNFNYPLPIPKLKAPAKSILKNSRRSCDSGVNMSGSALESTHSEYSYNSSDLETNISGFSARSSSKGSYVTCILKPKNQEDDTMSGASIKSHSKHFQNNNTLQVNENHHQKTEHVHVDIVINNISSKKYDGDSKTEQSSSNSNSTDIKSDGMVRLRPSSLLIESSSEEISQTVVLRRKSDRKQEADHYVTNENGVLLRNKDKNRDSVRLSKRMSCGKYSRIAAQWERLCKLNGQISPVIPKVTEERTNNKTGKKKENRDSSSSGDDTNVLDILSTPIMKKEFSFDFGSQTEIGSNTENVENGNVSDECIVTMTAGSVAAARSIFESTEVKEMRNIYKKALKISARLDD